MKKLSSLFLLPLVSAGHTGSQQVVSDSVSSMGPNWVLVIFILIVIGLAYWLLKGGSKK